MSPKPGIFDPWRQKTPTPAAAAKPGGVRIEEPTPDGDAPEFCFSFRGPRAGVNVWMDAPTENPEEVARARLKTLLSELEGLNQQDVSDALRFYTVTSTGASTVDNTAFALRRVLVRSPQAAALIAKHRVKAFVI